MEYFDKEFLKKIGSRIGKVLRVDKSTAYAERGQFTRLSVEIDLSKPLLSKFWLKGKIWRIQYEGIKMICYNCGKLGHSEDQCALNKVMEPMVVDQTNTILNNIHLQDKPKIHKPELKSAFGSWMQVKKPGRKRAPRPNKTQVARPKETVGMNKDATKGNLPANPQNSNWKPERNLGDGSRFTALNVENIEEVSEDALGSKDIHLEDINSREVVPKISFEAQPSSPTLYETVDLVAGSQNLAQLNNGPNMFMIENAEKIKKISSQNKNKQKIRSQIPKNPALQNLTNLNPPKDSQSFIPILPKPGKENQVATPKTPLAAPQKQINDATPTSLNNASTPIDPTHISPTYKCDHIENTSGEDTVRGSAHGDALLGHSRPPDPYSGGQDRDMVGADTGTPGIDSNPITSE